MATMASCYIIGDVDVTDPERYKDYSSHTESTLEPFGGRFIVRGGDKEILAGEWRAHRLVVLGAPHPPRRHRVPRPRIRERRVRKRPLPGDPADPPGGVDRQPRPRGGLPAL